MNSMKKGVCPKCQSKEVYMSEGYPHQREMITVSGTAFVKAVPPDRYACVSCGFVEFYLNSEEQFKEIREAWTKV